VKTVDRLAKVRDLEKQHRASSREQIRTVLRSPVVQMPAKARYVGNLAPMPGMFPDYPAPVVRNTDTGLELSMMGWGMPPPPRRGGRQSPTSATRRHRTGAAG
jgi:putative SOS response-associated peptidase YedK